MLVLAFIAEVCRSEQKNSNSGFKTLRGDRFANFQQMFENFKKCFFKAKLDKNSQEQRKVAELYFILAYQISEHCDQ